MELSFIHQVSLQTQRMELIAIDKCFNLFELMQKYDVPLLIHAETNNEKDIDIFDREKFFIDRHLNQIHKEFPRILKLCLNTFPQKKL